MKPKEVFVCIIPAVTMKLLLVPKKPEGVDAKSAYLDGQRPGCPVLPPAILVRDGQMKGEHIHILEKDPTARRRLRRL